MHRLLSVPFVLFTMLMTVTAGPAALAERIPVAFFGRGASPLVDLGDVDPAIPSPDDVLGFPLGERPASNAQVIEYLSRLREATPRVELVTMGQTYEGRDLVYAILSSPQNMDRIDEIKDQVQRIADPRTLNRSELPELIERTPAVVWLAYSIHGDEISGVDAALGVAYRLAAGTDSLTLRLLRELVVLIDPNENPDGRQRYLAQMESFATAVPFADGQSLQKGGFWPWGRGNHYLFDMNRDWFAQELVESRARIAAIVEWQPQVLVDAHEMGQWDTYLFSPPRHPFNPQLSPRIRQWWDTFAGDQARAFDRHGWAYYTREWNEEWYPGYGSSWPLYLGAIGILYEQAGVAGSRIARHDGTVLTYSESVAHQYVSSMANLTTAANNREILLHDYYMHRARAIEEFGGGPAHAFLAKPDANPDRLEHLAATLERQGIEVFVADAAFSARARSYYEAEARSRDFPAGSLVIPTDQPNGFLIQTILSFDLRIPDSFLTEERREILKHHESRLYEVTAWSMLPAYGLDAYETVAPVSAPMTRWVITPRSGGVVGERPQQGYLFDVSADRGLRAMVMLLTRGLTLYAARKDLDVDGHSFPRGSVFLPARANPPDYVRILDSVARETGVTFYGVESGKGSEGPDLGGSEVELLRTPKVAVVAAGPTSFTSLGAVWHLLDQKLGLPASLIDVTRLANLDLAIYNVLILPDSWGSFAEVIGEQAQKHLRQWIRDGGTLIALDGSAAFCADTSIALSSVRNRRQVLDQVDEYRQAALREIAAENPSIDHLAIWEYPGGAPVEGEAEAPREVSPEERARQDEQGRLFAPQGAILKVDLDTEHWLTAGLPRSIAAIVFSSNVLLARFPEARTVGRMAAPEELRISGLLWPEARQRIAHTAYLTHERLGRGQVVLFAGQPNFRAYFRGTERLLSNAVLYGPGLGTRWTPEW